jgi:hypothetical protein
MGLLSQYLASKAIDKEQNLALWVEHNLEWIDNLNERVIELEREVEELKKQLK